MYAWPVLLPAQTNREDMLRTVSLFDDDTGEAIDVSGRTLAQPGDFTGSNWTVTDGTIVTNSFTELTIKDYPFGNEMQALAFGVAENLGILANDPITIADPTGLNTMTGYVVSYAPSTGNVVAQIGCAFDFEIRTQHDHSDGYGESFSGLGVGDGGPIIRAQLGNGITVIGLGIVQIRIPVTCLFQLRHRTYSAAMILSDGADTRQLFVGKQPILSGGVSPQPFAQPSSANPYGLP